MDLTRGEQQVLLHRKDVFEGRVSCPTYEDAKALLQCVIRKELLEIPQEDPFWAGRKKDHTLNKLNDGPGFIVEIRKPGEHRIQTRIVTASVITPWVDFEDHDDCLYWVFESLYEKGSAASLVVT